MTFKTKATSILGYRVFPTSILALVVYVSLFVALIVTDALSNPPSPTKRGVLDLKQAYEDLRHVCPAVVVFSTLYAEPLLGPLADYSPSPSLQFARK